MQANLQEFIQLNYQPELANQLLEALVIFDTYGMDDHEIPLNNILYSGISQESFDDQSDRFVKVTKNFLVQLAAQFDLVLYEDITLEDTVEVFKALLDLEYYIDHDSIMRVLEAEESVMETLAALLELTSNKTSSWVFENILSVSDAFLAKVKETHDKPTSLDISTVEDPKDKIQASADQILTLRLYREYIQNEKLVCFKLIRRGTPIGLTFKEYFPYIQNRVEYEDLEPLSKELVGILYLSSDTCQDPIRGFREHSEFLFDSLNKITAMDVLVTKLITDFITYKSLKLNK